MFHERKNVVRNEYMYMTILYILIKTRFVMDLKSTIVKRNINLWTLMSRREFEKYYFEYILTDDGHFLRFNFIFKSHFLYAGKC